MAGDARGFFLESLCGLLMFLFLRQGFGAQFSCMNVVKEIQRLNEREVGSTGGRNNTSWHDQYRDSAHIFCGNLPFELSEGDVICMFSQFGTITDINLVRDEGTGKSKGFCFLRYRDQRSTILAVDNFNGIVLKGRTVRVDHCADYKAPKEDEEDDLDDKNSKPPKAEVPADAFGAPSVSRTFTEVRGEQDEHVAQNEQRKNRIEELLAKRKAERTVTLAADKAAFSKGRHAASNKGPGKDSVDSGSRNRSHELSKKHHKKRDRSRSPDGKKKSKKKDKHEHKETARGASEVPVSKERKKTGEISLSVDETNSLRATLGLKPLK